MTRFESLMLNAAKCFHEEQSPFDVSELVRLNVTSDECFQMSDAIATAIEFYLRHREQAVDERTVEAIRETCGAEIASQAESHLKLRRALAKVS